MTPERWQEIEDVFQAVIDLAPSERVSYLEKNHADDGDLIDEINKLIADYDAAEDFIESPVWTDSFMLGKTARGQIGNALNEEIKQDNGSLIGKRFGVYRLTKELGRGGMGAVYLAERDDGEFRQRVAVKVIKRGMDTDFIVRRFRNERQILATLDHSNIARLLDGGTTDDGLPFFVMEFIEGKPVYRYCDTEKLSIAERLQLFRQICFAVDYAHQNLIIHRDIKPSNILVTADGTPKLLDFGIAKILNPDLAADSIDPTATAMRMMTPEYASPEQVRGEAVTKVSDIYSLGVLLYELLTGHRPYRLKNRALHEIARVICEEEPESLRESLTREDNLVPTNGGGDHTTLEFIFENRNASREALRRELSGDLEKIVLKAMRKNPTERYQTAQEFAEDILRYLENHPVLAEGFESGKFEDFLHSTNPDEISIAVLPFKLLSAQTREDTGDEYLGIGLADALITRLSNIRRFVVRPTSSVLKYGNLETEPITAGEELRVNYVVDGNIRRIGKKLRVTAQLLNIEEGAARWAERFDEDFTDVLALEDSISEQIAEALLPQLSGDERERLKKRGTNSPEAYEAHLRGRFHWNQFTPESLLKAQQLFEQAVKLDPNYALAHVDLADFYLWGGIYGLIPTKEALALAETSLNRAIELDNQLGEAFASLGLVAQNRKKWEEAEVLRVKSVNLSPNYVHAHEWFGAQLVGTGETEEGVREMLIAESLDSLSTRTKTLVAWTLYQAHYFEEALKRGRQIVDLDKNYPQGHSQIGLALWGMGRFEESVPHFQKFDEMMPDSALPKYQLCFALVKANKRDEARKVLEEIKILASKTYVKPFFLGMAHAALDELDKAFEYFEQSFDEDEPWMLWLGTEPMLENIRNDTRYEDLMRRMKNPIIQAKSDDFSRTLRGSEKKSIAVLPLKVLQTGNTDDGEEEFLSIGLADALISRLTTVKRLIVRPTNSIVRFKTVADPFDAAREIKVGYIVDGSVRRADNRIRVSIQLLEVKNKTAIWAKTFDENLTDVLALEDSISKQIAEALVTTLTGEEQELLVNRGTENAEAYEAYLRGRFHWHKYTVEGLAKSLVCFYDAIALDPNYAAPYGGVADYYNYLSIFGIMSPQESFPAAKEAALKAIELDPNLADAYHSLAVVSIGYDWDYDEAQKYLDRALHLNPNSAEAHLWQGQLFSHLGKHNQAIRELEIAISLDPQSASLLTRFALVLRNARQFEKGVQKLREAILYQANNPTALSCFSWFVKHLDIGKEAEKMCLKAVEISQRQNLPLYAYGYTLAVLGRHDEAREIAEELEARRANYYVPPIYIALIYVEIDKEKAFKWIAKAFDERDFWAIWIPLDPRFDSLKTDSRYDYFVGKIKPQKEEEDIHQSHIATRVFQVVEPEKPRAEKSSEIPQEEIRPSKTRKKLWIYAVVVIGVLGILIYAGILKLNFTSNVGSERETLTNIPKPPIPPQPNGVKTIALLPFETDADQENEESFANGLAESVGEKLRQVKEFSLGFVYLKLKNNPELDELAKNYAVNYALRGKLHIENDRVIVNAELVNTADGKVLWTESFNENINSFQNLQATISQRVLKALTVDISANEREQISKKYTENNEAYQLYLVGRFQLSNRSTANLNKAIKTFEKARNLDSNFALAYAGLADSYALLNLYQIPPPPDAYGKAKQNALKAIELDPDLAEAHASLGYVLFYHEHKRDEAVRSLGRAIELNPGYSTAYHWLALIFSAMGRHDEAIRNIQRAIELEPKSAIIQTAAGLVYFYARKYPDALATAEKVLENNEGFVPAYKTKRVVFEATGNYSAALTAYQNERIYSENTDEDDTGWMMIAAQVQAVGNNRDEALSNLKRTTESSFVKSNPTAFAYEIALAYGLLGESDAAVEWLKKAKAVNAYGFNFAQVDPRFDKIRNDKRFAELFGDQ